MPLAPRQVGGMDNGYVYSEPLIRCVLAGHIHFNYESLLPVILRKGGISVFSGIGSV